MKKKSNWRADEMEMAVNFKAMRLSWAFLTLSLAIWSWVDVIRNGTLGTQFHLLMVSQVVIWTAKFWMTRRMTRPEAGSNDE